MRERAPTEADRHSMESGAWVIRMLATFAFALVSACATSAGETNRLTEWLFKAAATSQPDLLLENYEGWTFIVPGGSDVEIPAPTSGQFLAINDGVRTGTNFARARLVNAFSLSAMDQKSDIIVLPPRQRPVIRLRKGTLYYKSLATTWSAVKAKTLIETTNGIFECHGTEFQVEVDPTSQTTRIHLMDGDGTLTSTTHLGTNRSTNLISGTIGTLVGTNAPTRTAAVEAVTRTVQWMLYYPAVLDPDDIPEAARADPDLRRSIERYRTGDLLGAVAALPEESETRSVHQVYVAALLLSVGQVRAAQNQLTQFPSLTAPGVASTNHADVLARALRQLIQTVQLQPVGERPRPSLATEWLAESYYQQSRGSRLGGGLSGTSSNPPPALDPTMPWEAHSYRRMDSPLLRAFRAATNAIVANPASGFAWARRAELEFSLGRPKAAEASLIRALMIATNHAQALAVRGFLDLARRGVEPATNLFGRALSIDGSLGNAWLGLGLAEFRQGRPEEGLRYLQLAVSREPQRSLLRSYLGKGYYEAAISVPQPLSNVSEYYLGRSNRADLVRWAQDELALARQFDTNDPTPYLYESLIHFGENRVNEAVGELERSIALNDNRALYRSGLLLDQDRAMRRANLAAIYRDAGLLQWSVNEASRAVNADYSNPSARLFLANSYDQLRDPFQVNLRYETAWSSELLMANLLAPVGGGSLSTLVSQQEYSGLFERPKPGLLSITTYDSRGQWNQAVSQHGTFQRFDYSLDAAYRSGNLNERGDRPNSDFESLSLWGKFKVQLTPEDDLLFQCQTLNAEFGDVAAYYWPTQASRTQRVREEQLPNAWMGYHRRYDSGAHTLALVGRLTDSLERTNSGSPALLVTSRTNGIVQFMKNDRIPHQLDFDSDLVAYSAEVQQFLELGQVRWIGGLRYQQGESETWADSYRGEANVFERGPVPADARRPTAPVNTDLERFVAYSYVYWAALTNLNLTAGFAYDELRFPRAIEIPPVNAWTDSEGGLFPKFGLEFAPSPRVQLRGAYTRSLGGVFYDQSVRLEPVQVAGFLQAFRSVIPESVVGLIPGAEFETLGAAADVRVGRGSFVTLNFERVESEAQRTLGMFEQLNHNDYGPGWLDEQLHYREISTSVSWDQLLCREVSVGVQYRVAWAELDQRFDDVSPTAVFLPGVTGPPVDISVNSLLQTVRLYAIVNHSSGLFGGMEGVYYDQENRDFPQPVGHESFWDANVWMGYRFPQRRAELRLALLNLTDHDHRLHPLNAVGALPRVRTLTVSLKLEF